MRKFTFHKKNSSATLTLSALSFEDAEQELFNLVASSYGWKVEDKDGVEDEDYEYYNAAELSDEDEDEDG